MAKENNNCANTKFNNSKFNIQLLDTTNSSTCKNIVAKNAPFQIIITLKDNNNNLRKTTTNSNLLGSLTKDKVSLKLVYENDLENQVHVLTTKPLDYNVYLRGDSLTIETRIHVLSSKHENNLFKIILSFGDQTIYTDSIKCVSKLVCETKKKPAAAAAIATTVPVLKVKKTPSSTSSQSSSSTEKKSLSKTIKKLQELRKKDRDLISLLYQQNKQMVDQLNTISNVVNSLVSNHNISININSNNNTTTTTTNNNTTNNNTNNYEIFSSPGQTIPYTPTQEYNNNNNNNNYENNQQQTSYMDYPVIDTDIIDSLPTESSLNSYPSVVSQCSNAFSENEVFTSQNTNNAAANEAENSVSLDSIYSESNAFHQISTY